MVGGEVVAVPLCLQTVPFSISLVSRKQIRDAVTQGFTSYAGSLP